MRRVILFTLCLVFISVSAVWATDAPVPKSPEVLQLEMDVLQGQRAVMVSELNRYLLQVEFLRLKIPVMQEEIKALDGQIRKKLSENAKPKPDPDAK